MRVALLYPEVYDMARFREGRREFPPFGVLYLAASVRQAGHDVDVLKVVKGQGALDLSGYAAVGFSLASSATYGVMLAARRDARIEAGTLVMVGGVHANFYPHETFDDFDPHVVSFGESDSTIVEILARARTLRFDGIPGVLWRDGEQMRRSAALPAARDISHLPLPARDLLQKADVVMHDRLAGGDLRMAHTMFSRGCPFPCSFCAAGRTRIQYRDGASARRELEQLVEAYGIDGYAIVDDNFIVNKERVRDICRSTADLGLRWSALSRVDTVDQSLLAEMADAGCIEVKFGVESGSERLLKAMQKNTTQQQIRDAVGWAADCGIAAKAFIVHGFPGEDLDSTRQTIRLLDELGDRLARVSLFRFVPLPGTQAYDQPAAHRGIRGTHRAPDWDGDWEKFHIHHNDRHWWGDDDDFRVLQAAYAELAEYVEQRWGPQC